MRAIHRLSDRKVRNAMPGMHADGGNLLLQVTIGAAGNINKSWLFRYSRSGHERRMGLGTYPAVTLAEARQRAADARKLLTAGKDPLSEKNAQRSSPVSPVKRMPFAIGHRA